MTKILDFTDLLTNRLAGSLIRLSDSGLNDRVALGKKGY